MPNFRSSQMVTFHQLMFDATQSWSEIHSNSLLNYLFEHGTNMPFCQIWPLRMSTLMLDYEYELERIAQSVLSIQGLMTDFLALRNVPTGRYQKLNFNRWQRFYNQSTPSDTRVVMDTATHLSPVDSRAC